MKKYLTRLTAALLALVLLIAPASALTVDQALELLEEYYYYDIPEEAYEADSLDELFDLLDPYTVYMSREEYESFLGSLEGEANVVGIGVSIQYTQEGILVVEALSGGGAQSAGLREGDLIVEANGVSCVPAGEHCRELLMGEEGTPVTVTVLRDGAQLKYTIVRRPVVVPTVRFRLLEGGVGCIDCDSFGMETGAEFAKLLKEHNSEVDRWIVDLRDNRGGYTTAAVDMLGALSGPGWYLYFQNGAGGVSYEESDEDRASAKPVMLLTNGVSASASELVASGVRDAARGITVGGRTYGKGMAQRMCDEDVFPEYFDGDGMKVTTDRFYSLNMNTTDRVGVIPTLLVDDADVDAVALALCGQEENAQVGVLIRGDAFYVDADTDEETMAALFEALPPQVSVFYSGGGVFDELLVPAAAEKLGLDYDNRWFNDVADSDYVRAINAMGTYRLLNGTGGGAFSPDSELTRAQLCVMLARVLNVRYGGASQFTDVEDGIWYADAVNAIAALGLVEGMGEGRFDPDGMLTQEQFLTVMGRVARFLNLRIDDYGAWLESGSARLVASQERSLRRYASWAQNGAAVLAWGVEDAMDEKGTMLYAPLDDITPDAVVLREEAAAGMYAVLHGLGILL